MGIAEDEDREDTFVIPPDRAFEYLSRRFTDLETRASRLEADVRNVAQPDNDTRESRETRRQQDRVAGAILVYWLGVQLNGVVGLLTEQEPDVG